MSTQKEKSISIYNGGLNAATLANEWKKKSMLELWHTQVVQHHEESYRGISLLKFPQDLWNYEKLIDSYMPNIVVEVGVNKGGFTQWLADRLFLRHESKDDWHVFGIDISVSQAQENISSFPQTQNNVTYYEGDLRDTAFINKVYTSISNACQGKKLMLIEDSAHTYDVTKIVLDNFSPLIPPGGWLIVEDTCVDIEDLRQQPNWPRGALIAMLDFLGKNSDFCSTDFNNTYGISCHPFGFLTRKPTN